MPQAAQSADFLDPDQVTYLRRHAAYGRRIFQLTDPVHFVQTETDQGLPLIGPSADGTADLGYSDASWFLVSHWPLPRLRLPQGRHVVQ